MLYGCSRRQRDLNIACTPECIGGLKHPDTEYCDIQTYNYRDSRLTKPNEIKNGATSAYLFTDVEDVPATVRDQIKNDGMTSVCIYLRSSNSSDYRYLRDEIISTQKKPSPHTSTSLSSPTYSSLPSPSSISSSTPSNPHQNEEGKNTWLWLLLIIFIFLLIIGGLVYWNGRRKRS
jgi:hypothetical protein